MGYQNGINADIIENLISLLNSFNNYLPKELTEGSYSQEVNSAYLFMKFADTMPGGFFIYHADENENIIYANSATLRIFNCDTMEELRELTNNSFRGMIHPDDLEDVEKSIEEQIENSQYDLDYVEYRILTKDGQTRYVEDYGHFVRNEELGDIFYVFIADATEKMLKRMEDRQHFLNENKKKEELLQTRIQEYDNEIKMIHQEQLRNFELIEGLSIDYVSIFYVDLEANQIKAYRVSSKYEDQFRKENRLEEFTGFDTVYIERWVHPEDRAILKGVTNPKYIREKLTGKREFHINYRTLEGEKVTYMQLRIVNVGSEERVSQIVLGYRNIDDEIIQEMQHNQIIKDALHKANAANSAKSLFLSNMSHDIRTPMNAIVGFASLAKKRIDNRDKAIGYLDMILESSDQLLQLLNDVLEISRIESGKVQLEKAECDLMDVAHQIQTLMLPHAAQKNITLSLDISNLKHTDVYADHAKISQILAYLVDNAIKYTNPDGRIKIKISEKNELYKDCATYCFEVEDNGIGISEKFLEHIFNPFEREKNTTHSGIHGTGLGLTIVKELVDMIGGSIDIDSTVGEGSRFTIMLPLSVHESQKEDFGSNDDVSMHFSSAKRILIVDDNEINLEIENEVLKDAGFLVDTAVDGDIAVEKVKKSQPGYYDLILMDIQMPTMDGYHATRAIRKLENPALSGIPIIAVSANTFDEDKKKAMESGMNAHLAKPLDTSRLYKLIWKFLKGAEKAKKKVVRLDEVIVRPIKESEYVLLEDFLYEAIYQPEGVEALPDDIIDKPEINVYISDFGKLTDFALVAEYEQRVIGMIWSRIFSGGIKGYGTIDEYTPELAMSVSREFRRRKIGWKLIQSMVTLLKDKGYEKVSVSVNKENYAYQMYRKLGFQIYSENDDDCIMTLEL